MSMISEQVIDLTVVPDDYIVMHHKTEMVKRLNDKYVVYEVQKENVPLVRCKNCKHWYNDADTGMACEFTNMGQPEDGYCNWGERRTDG